MFTKTGFGRAVSVAIVISGLALGASARAQDVPEEHVQAARAAISALGLTNQFDNILPTLAERLKRELILNYPNLEDQISATVDQTALSLAPRRADLEREAALVYAKSFSVEELKAIADFYGSETGKKLLKDGPIAAREMLKAADIWASGIQRDLSTKTNEEMLKLVPTQQPADGAAAEGTAAPANP
ncbi:DUF2059 domain-containing protein [Ciceribacter sp. L1K23]|uniref:DUF2059 domain-containing protein n=1 Tax=unclassified Ciceribacter TaxID=2628820 RepID=UPI001ABEB435|nr:MULTISPECIES: DUF2059 domain-containing protein [unclassified Ciceribacter]MBO3760692.1 DUF2059 domain-containing protein [Ciceribacter sp. L1K22]MBR0555251.1 DUF2059 domain-containing protein [Ciceribacter sp. L1K23]